MPYRFHAWKGNDQHNAVHEIKGMTSDQMLSTNTMNSQIYICFSDDML